MLKSNQYYDREPVAKKYKNGLYFNLIFKKKKTSCEQSEIDAYVNGEQVSIECILICKLPFIY